MIKWEDLKQRKMSRTLKPALFIIMSTLLTGVSLILMSCSPPEEALSKESIKNLKNLNEKYALKMSELNAEVNPLKRQLLNANLLENNKETQKHGFILSVESKNESEYFILNPHKVINEKVIKQIEEEYINIPEVKIIEMDQDIVIFEGKKENLETVIKKGNFDGKPAKQEVVKIAILDTGLEAEHEVFKNIKINMGWNSIEKNGNIADDLGHGTHIAGLIAQSKASVELTPYKVANKETGRLSHVIAALEKMEDQELNIINMSFGFEERSKILEELLGKKQKEGVLIIAAAGNENKNNPVYPAAYQDVIAVGAVNAIGRTLSYSNYGNWVDLAAEGHYIVSALPSNEYGHRSGTSQATAKVTAYIAEQLKQKRATESLDDFLLNLIEKKSVVKSGNLKGIPMI